MSLRTGILVRLVIYGLLLCQSGARGADWPCLGGPRHDGISRESLGELISGKVSMEVAWKREVGTGFASVVVADGRVITTGNADDQDTVVCLDATDGQEHWRFTYGAPLDDRDFDGGPTSTPTISRDCVFTLSREGELFCLDLETGNKRWHRQIVDEADVRVPGWGFGGSVRVVGDIVLVTAGEAGLAFNRKDGSLRWKSADKESGYATPATYQHQAKTFAIIPSGRSFSAVDVQTGESAWQLRWLTTFGCNAANPVIHDEYFMLSSAYNRGSALYRMTSGEPSLVWKSKELQAHLNGCLLIDDMLYGIDGDLQSGSRLKCVEFMTGEVQWSQTDLDPGALTATREHLIVLTNDGHLVIGRVSNITFAPLARTKVLDGTCWTTPVLSGGRIFCRDSSGTLAQVSLVR